MPRLLDEAGYLAKTVPVLWLSVGKDIPRGTKITGKLKVIEDHDGTLTGIEARPAALESAIGIEVRGSSSANKYLQKPYGFELRDAAGMGNAQSLLGLPREADFALHSCYSDKSCMRNALVYAIGREMSAPRGKWWAPQTRWVEMFLDGKHQGMYLLTEKVTHDKNRVVLPAPDDKLDRSGGYLVSAEGPGKVIRLPGAEWTDPATTLHFYYHFPRFDQITSPQRTYVQTAIANLGKSIGGAGWRDRADLPTWVDYFLVQELTSNTDGFYKSWYFAKQPDRIDGGKWSMGPLWDFDIALGNVNYNRNLCWNNTFRGTDEGGPFANLWQDAAFTGALRCRWNELRQAGGPLDVDRIEAKLTAFAGHMERAKKRDQDRWKNIGSYVWPNNYIGATHTDEVKYLRSWLRRRLAWLDRNLAGSCAGKAAPPTVTPLPLPPAVMTGARANMPGGTAEPYVNPEAGPSAALKYSCPAQ